MVILQKKNKIVLHELTGVFLFKADTNKLMLVLNYATSFKFWPSASNVTEMLFYQYACISCAKKAE